jgi:hypothetical protein
MRYWLKTIEASFYIIVYWDLYEQSGDLKSDELGLFVFV